MLIKKATTWILVCDGARGKVLVNEGKGTGLTEIEHAEHEESREMTRELGADRPGRSYDSVGGGRHSMVNPADWHQFEKTQFAKEMAAIVNAAALENQFDRLIVAAPPKVLGDLRKAFNAQVGQKIGGEIGKDLTQVPVHDLGQHFEGLVNL